MEASNSQVPAPPFSRKVIVQALSAAVAAVAVHFGLDVPAFAQAEISVGVGLVAGIAVREQRVFLEKALAYLQSIGK